MHVRTRPYLYPVDRTSEPGRTFDVAELHNCFFKSNTPDGPSPEECIVRFLVSLLHAIKTPFFWWIFSVHLLGLILRVLHFSCVTDVAIELSESYRIDCEIH